MRLTVNDLQYLFRSGMVMRRLDEPRDIPMRGIALPHPGNADWFDLWPVEDMNTVLPREVEPDGLGGYLFTLPGGDRRRIHPLAEAEKFSLGTSDSVSRTQDHESDGVAAPADSGGALHIALEEDDPATSAMEYLLVHYAANGFPWGIWRSPDDYVYSGAHATTVEHGRRTVTGRVASVPWLEWIDSIAWNPPDRCSRWDLYKTDGPVSLEEVLRNLQGGLSYAEYVLTNGDGDSAVSRQEERYEWLQNHNQDSADWTDEDIRAAKGVGMN